MRSFRKEDVVGKAVIETSGTVRGKVKDIVFDLSGAITLVVEQSDGKEWQVPIARVTGISDHVVVRTDTGTQPSGTTCKFCGATLTPGRIWCPSCGKSQV
jgi:sporulation protein YlmC with PRC-barrel domain